MFYINKKFALKNNLIDLPPSSKTLSFLFSNSCSPLCLASRIRTLELFDSSYVQTIKSNLRLFPGHFSDPTAARIDIFLGVHEMLPGEEILELLFKGQVGLPCRQRYPKGISGRENRMCKCVEKDNDMVCLRVV